MHSGRKLGGEKFIFSVFFVITDYGSLYGSYGCTIVRVL